MRAKRSPSSAVRFISGIILLKLFLTNDKPLQKDKGFPFKKTLILFLAGCWGGMGEVQKVHLPRELSSQMINLCKEITAIWGVHLCVGDSMCTKSHSIQFMDSTPWSILETLKTPETLIIYIGNIRNLNQWHLTHEVSVVSKSSNVSDVPRFSVLPNYLIFLMF